MSRTDFVTIDDMDTTQITYQGDWRQLRGAQETYMGTAHLATNTAASATFIFNGTSVKVVGTLRASEMASSKYTLDNNEPVQFTSPNISSASFQEQLYVSPLLDHGRHTLVVQLVTEGQRFYLDFIQYNVTSTVSGPVSTSATPTATSIKSDGPHPHRTHLGELIGGIIGAVIVLGIAVFFLTKFLRRRHKRARAILQPTPFALSPFMPSSRATRTAATSSAKSRLRDGQGAGVRWGLASALPTSHSGTPAASTESLGLIPHHNAASVPLTRAELPPAYEDQMEVSNSNSPYIRAYVPANECVQHIPGVCY